MLISVTALGLIAGVMLAAFLSSRPDGSLGQASATAAVTDSAPAAQHSESPIPSPSEPSAAPSVDPTITAEATQSAVPSGPATLAWEGGSSQSGRVNRAIRFGDRWIAGGALEVGPTLRGAVWTSTDGVDWGDPIVLGPEPIESDGFWPRYWVNGFGEWDGDLLAFGWNGVGCCDGGYPMLWRTSDGDAWEVVDTAGTPFGDEYHFPRTAADAPDGQLAVFSATGLGNGSAIFLTPDLQSWELHRIPAPDPTDYMAVTAAAPTRLLAVANEQPPYEVGEDRPAAILHAWTSTDARSWNAIDPPANAVSVVDIAWDELHNRFVAIGNDADGLPYAWITIDGTSWTGISLGEERARMHRIAATAGLIAATGESGPGDTVVWSSHDGTSWWYTTVLERRLGTVEAVTTDSALLIAQRWSEDEGDSWRSVVGTVPKEE